MIAMRHVGLYVEDIERLEEFYKAVFRMIPICSSQPDEDALFDELLGIRSAHILTTKLVTEYGKRNGQGDMLELVKLLDGYQEMPKMPANHPIFIIGGGTSLSA